MNVGLDSLLAIEFIKQFKINFRYAPFSMATVKSTKWWTHFVNFSNKFKFKDEDEVCKFMKYLFDRYISEHNKKLYPYFLSTKEGSIYYKEFFQEKEADEISENYNEVFMENTLREILKWCKNNKKSIKEFIEDHSNYQKIIRGNLYLPLFLFSKTFMDKYGEVEATTILYEKSIFRRTFPSVYYDMKQILKDDYLDDGTYEKPFTRF